MPKSLTDVFNEVEDDLQLILSDLEENIRLHRSAYRSVVADPAKEKLKTTHNMIPGWVVFIPGAD